MQLPSVPLAAFCPTGRQMDSAESLAFRYDPLFCPLLHDGALESHTSRSLKILPTCVAARPGNYYFLADNLFVEGLLGKVNGSVIQLSRLQTRERQIFRRTQSSTRGLSDRPRCQGSFNLLQALSTEMNLLDQRKAAGRVRQDIVFRPSPSVLCKLGC